MTNSAKNVTARRFVSRLLLANAAYVALTISVAFFFYKFHPRGVIAYVLAVLPSGGIIASIVATGAYVKAEKDEFQRDLLMQCLLSGLGGVMAVTTVWGLLESFTHIARFQPMWTFPLFCSCIGVAFPFVSRRYR